MSIHFISVQKSNQLLNRRDQRTKENKNAKNVLIIITDAAYKLENVKFEIDIFHR